MLEMPEDDNMSIFLKRPFLNTAEDVINCNQGKVTFNVNDKEHIVYFPKKIERTYGLNSIEHVEGIQVGEIYCPIPREKFETIGTIAIKVEVT